MPIISATQKAEAGEVQVQRHSGLHGKTCPKGRKEEGRNKGGRERRKEGRKEGREEEEKNNKHVFASFCKTGTQCNQSVIQMTTAI